MVDFVLQKFGEIAVVAGAEHMLHALLVPVADGNFAMALDLHENREEAQAGVPDHDFFCTTLNDLRVDEGAGLFSGKLQETDAQRHAQLRGGDAAAVAGAGAPVRKRQRLPGTGGAAAG